MGHLSWAAPGLPVAVLAVRTSYPYLTPTLPPGPKAYACNLRMHGCSYGKKRDSAPSDSQGSSAVERTERVQVTLNRLEGNYSAGNKGKSKNRINCSSLSVCSQVIHEQTGSSNTFLFSLFLFSACIARVLLFSFPLALASLYAGYLFFNENSILQRE